MSNSNFLNRREWLIGAGVAALAAGCGSANSTAQSEPPTAETKPVETDQPSTDPVDLSGTSILITGSSSGFGRLGAEHYARLGAKVFATMRNLPRPEAEALEQLAKDENLDLTVIELDVTKDDQVASAMAEALELCDGKLDVLINNAGISYAGPIEVQDMEATQHLFDTNVYGPHRLARAALPAMRQAGSGYIINVSSQLGRVMIPGIAMYSPTKFALEAMSEQMAYEVVQHGVEVTIVQPGGYPTKIWDNARPLAAALKGRLNEEQLAAYPILTAGMDGQGGGGGSTDPMDIPHAIVEMIAMPKGSRPLRRAVHPGNRPQLPINEISAQQQLAMLGDSGYGPWVKAVHNVDD